MPPDREVCLDEIGALSDEILSRLTLFLESYMYHIRLEDPTRIQFGDELVRARQLVAKWASDAEGGAKGAAY